MPALRLSLTVCRGDAAEIGEGADMRGDPVRQLLAPDRLGVGEARGAEHGDEDLHRHDLAGDGHRPPPRCWPAKSTNSFSPATWTWRIVGFSRPAQAR